MFDQILSSFEELLTFNVTYGIGGGLVWADIGLLMAAIWGALSLSAKKSLPLWGTISHAICRAIGLSLFLFFGMGLGSKIGAVFIVFAAYIGLCFTTQGLQEGDDEDDETVVKALNTGGFFAVMATLMPVSIDEGYVMLQKTQWMQVQGWNGYEIFANFVLSMVVLYALLKFTGWLLNRGRYAVWAEKNEDMLMFCAFALINYYIIRAVLQNLLGFDGLLFWELQYTGIAIPLLAISFFGTAVLQRLLDVESFSKPWNFIFREWEIFGKSD